MESEVEIERKLDGRQCYQILQGNANSRCIPPGNNDCDIVRDANGVLYAFTRSKAQVAPWHPVGDPLPKERALKVLEDNLNAVQSQEIRPGKLTCCI